MNESNIALEVNGLSKRFRKEKVTNSFRQAMIDLIKPKPPKTFIWALKDVSFTIKKGQIIGIIGKNGSGKSTLLSILSGVTKPTTGTVDIYGKVASILDIGTGFHPDLTGRENVYLKGQLYGLSKADVKEMFDEVVEFSGIAPYIDMPVKFYSNGMFLRLAFSFLTHLDVSIFLFDEVLAVGDVGFQQKCIQKIQEIAAQGKTILFVSHNTLDLLNICDSFMQLEDGQMVGMEDGASVLLQYMDKTIQEEQDESYEEIGADRSWDNRDDAPGNELFYIKKLKIAPLEGEAFLTSQPLEIEVVFEKLTEEHILDVAFTLSDNVGNLFLAAFPHKIGKYFNTAAPGTYRVKCTIPKNLLNNRTFFINTYIIQDREEMIFTLKQSLQFEMFHPEKNPLLSDNLQQLPTPLTPALDWELSANGTEQDK